MTPRHAQLDLPFPSPAHHNGAHRTSTPNQARTRTHTAAELCRTCGDQLTICTRGVWSCVVCDWPEDEPSAT